MAGLARPRDIQHRAADVREGAVKISDHHMLTYGYQTPGLGRPLQLAAKIE
jgi:hypothetical protein